MTPRGCPTPQQIREFLLGQSSGDVDFSSHLDECVPCGQLADKLDAASDSVIAELRVNLDDYDSQPVDLSGSNLGDYRLIRRIGAGGMGTVYQGLHANLKKLVAIKLLPMGPAISEAALPRFRTEMEAAARVDSAHVVRAMDAREIDGQHFLVMEHVDGIDLSQLISAEGPLPIIDACEIVRQAALGIHSIHAAGMVHRDIKPSNLILSTEGVLKVVDLGLAFLGTADRQLRPNILDAADDTVVDSGQDSRLTRTGHRLGTAHYVAPEQALGSSDVDWRADIFSLGCTLFYLISGNVPSSEPWGEPLDNASQSLRWSQHRVPRRLEELVRRMLSPDPQQRCASALEVAERLDSIILQEELPRTAPPHAAHSPGLTVVHQALKHRKAVARQRRWLRTLTVAVTSTAILAGLIAFAFPELLVTRRAAPDKVELRPTDIAVRTPQVVTLKLTPEDLTDMDRIFFAMDLARVSVQFGKQSSRYTIWDAHTGRKLTEKHLTQSELENELRDKPGSAEPAIAGGSPQKTALRDSQPPQRSVRMFGTRSLRTSGMNRLSFFDLEKGIDVTLDSGLPNIQQLAMSFNGRHVAVTGGDKILIWDFETQSCVKEIAWPGANRVYLSSDGKIMACISQTGELLVSRWEQGFSMTPYTNGELDAAAFAWNAPVMAYADRSGFVMVLDCNSFKWLADHQWELSRGERFINASFSEDRKQLALASSHGKIYRIDVDLTQVAMGSLAEGGGPPLEFVRNLDGHQARVTSVAFSSDGRSLISGGDDRSVRTFDVTTGTLTSTSVDHTTFVRDIAFAASQKVVLSASEDLTVKGFAWPSMDRIFSHQFPERPIELAALAGGDQFAVSTIGGKIYLDAIAAPQPIEIAAVAPSGTTAACLCVTRAGHLLAADSDGLVHEFDLDPMQPIRTLLKAPSGIASIALSEDKGILVAGCYDGTIQTWRWPEGELHQHWRAHNDVVSAICFSPSGASLASGCRLGELRVWDTASCFLTGLGNSHSDTIRDIKFSPDGHLIASAAHDCVIKLWRAPHERSDER